MNAHRVNVIDTLQLIADFKSQIEYQESVPFVGVATEMCCQWFDDFYHPAFPEFAEQFTETELCELESFTALFEQYVDVLPETLTELHRDLRWAAISNAAHTTLMKLNWLDIEAVYDAD